MDTIKKYLTLKNIAVVLGVLFIIGGIYYIFGSSTGVSTPLGKIAGTKTLADYIDRIEGEFEYQQVRYVAPQEIQSYYPVELVANVQRTGDNSQRAYSELKLPDLTFNTDQYGKVVIKQPVVKIINVIEDQSPSATYFSLDISNIDDVLTKLQIKQLLDIMAAYPTYSVLINDAVNPILYEKAWLYISEDDMKKLQEQAGGDTTVEYVQVSPKDLRKAVGYVARGIVIVEEGTENGMKKLVLRPDVDGLIVGLKKLRKDDELLNKLNIKRKELDKVIKDLEDMDEKKRKQIESLRFAMYLDKEGGKYRTTKVTMFMVLDDEQSKELSAKLQEEISTVKDAKLRGVIEAFKTKAEKDKRLDFGYLEFGYNKVEVQLPSEENIVKFTQIMQILGTLGAAK